MSPLVGGNFVMPFPRNVVNFVFLLPVSDADDFAFFRLPVTLYSFATFVVATWSPVLVLREDAGPVNEE